jgi:DNA-binding NarL/FixJ family response regulator
MLIASRNVMFLEGIGAILRQEPSIEIVGEARNLKDTVEKTDCLEPHIVLLDAVLTDGSTLEAIQCMRKSHERIGILVLNVSGRMTSTAELMDAGASAYISPETPMERLMDLIRATSPPGSACRKPSFRNTQSCSEQTVEESRKPGARASGFDDERVHSKASLAAIAQTRNCGAKEGRGA